MDREELLRRLDRGLRLQQIICGGLALAVVLYAVAALALVGTGFLGPILELATEFQALAAGAGFVVVLLATPVSRALLARAEAVRPRDPARLLDTFQRSTLVGYVLRETGAVVGVVVTLLTGNVLWVLLTSGVALVTMALAWPRRGAVEDWLLAHGLSG